MNTATKNTRQILYVSDARYGLTQEDIEQILSTSRRKNPDKEVSGILIYVDGVFVQVLEGPTIEIDGLYGTIANDSRHENVEILSDRFVQERTFSNWAMAYLETTAAGLAEHAGIPGMLDRSHLLKMLSSDDGRLRAFLHNLARLPS